MLVLRIETWYRASRRSTDVSTEQRIANTLERMGDSIPVVGGTWDVYHESKLPSLSTFSSSFWLPITLLAAAQTALEANPAREIHTKYSIENTSDEGGEGSDADPTFLCPVGERPRTLTLKRMCGTLGGGSLRRLNARSTLRVYPCTIPDGWYHGTRRQTGKHMARA
eukprot:828751-Rhodomonas_salina.2